MNNQVQLHSVSGIDDYNSAAAQERYGSYVLTGNMSRGAVFVSYCNCTHQRFDLKKQSSVLRMGSAEDSRVCLID